MRVTETSSGSRPTSSPQLGRNRFNIFNIFTFTFVFRLSLPLSYVYVCVYVCLFFRLEADGEQKSQMHVLPHNFVDKATLLFNNPSKNRVQQFEFLKYTMKEEEFQLVQSNQIKSKLININNDTLNVRIKCLKISNQTFGPDNQPFLATLLCNGDCYLISKLKKHLVKSYQVVIKCAPPRPCHWCSLR